MAEQVTIDNKPVSDNSASNKDVFLLIKAVRKGLPFSAFMKLIGTTPFPIEDWFVFLHLSRTNIYNYRKNQKRFESLYADRILDIILFSQQGKNVFGNDEKFLEWVNTKSVALAGNTPKSLMDTGFGISYLMDELTRLEHGVTA